MALRLLRLKPGCGPESARVVHLTAQDIPPAARLGAPGDAVRVLCGLYLVPGTYDVLSGIAGMPCESCEINSPGPQAPAQIDFAGVLPSS